MKTQIYLADKKDKDLLCESITMGIRDLADIRDRADGWGCSKMEMQDRIDRLQRILKETSEGEQPKESKQKVGGIKMYSKEFYDMLDFFERNIGKLPGLYVPSGFDRENKELWVNGFVYQNGEINKLYLAFMCGYTHGLSEANEE